MIPTQRNSYHGGLRRLPLFLVLSLLVVWSAASPVPQASSPIGAALSQLSNQFLDVQYAAEVLRGDLTDGNTGISQAVAHALDNCPSLIDLPRRLDLQQFPLGGILAVHNLTLNLAQTWFRWSRSHLQANVGTCSRGQQASTALLGRLDNILHRMDLALSTLRRSLQEGEGEGVIDSGITCSTVDRLNYMLARDLDSLAQRLTQQYDTLRQRFAGQ